MQAAHEFRYEQIAMRISRMIETGTIRAGERVPSVRKLSKESGASISTVLQAYLWLENQGWIEARPQSGFYARVNPEGLPPQPEMSTTSKSPDPVNVADLVVQVMQSARDSGFVALGAASPSPELFPTEKLHRSQSAVIRRVGSLVQVYDISPGNQELRRQIARRSIHSGSGLSTEDIVVTCGCIEALNLCLRAVTKPGDVVAIESPTYFGILQILENLHLKALEIATHPNHGVDPDALKAAIRKHKVAACLLMPNFHNPLGSCMPDENKKEVVEILASREIPLIEDDIYGDLPYGVRRPVTAKSFDKHGLVLLCASFSKILAPGYRIGWTAPGRFQSSVERLKLMTTMGTGTLPQLVIAEFLQHGGYDRYLRGIRTAYRSQSLKIAQAVGKYFPDGTRATRPAGGVVLWVELPERVDATELYRRAFQKKISIAPGTLFSTKNQYLNFIRLNCGQVWTDRLDRALLTLGQIAHELNHKAARRH